MPVTKLSISLDEQLAEALRERARRSGRSVSALTSELVADGLRNAALDDAFAAFEAEHGVVTEQMLREVRDRHPTRHYGPREGVVDEAV